MHSCCFQKKRISNKALIGLRFIFSGYSSDRSLQDVSVQALRQKRRVKGLTLTHPGHMGIVSIVVKWPQQGSQYDASDDKRVLLQDALILGTVLSANCHMVNRPCNNRGELARPRSAVMQTGAFKSLQESTQDGLEAMKVPVALFQAPKACGFSSVPVGWYDASGPWLQGGASSPIMSGECLLQFFGFPKAGLVWAPARRLRVCG